MTKFPQCVWRTAVTLSPAQVLIGEGQVPQEQQVVIQSRARVDIQSRAQEKIELNAWSSWHSASAPTAHSSDVTNSGTTPIPSPIEPIPQNFVDAPPHSSAGIIIPVFQFSEEGDEDPATCSQVIENIASEASAAVFSAPYDTKDAATTCAATGSTTSQSNHHIGDVKFDIPGKSWDRKTVCKLWNRMNDDAASDLICPWLKDRYFQKHGVSNMMDMEKAIAALSNVELNALLDFCKTTDAEVLDIPIYKVRSLADDDADSLDANSQDVALNGPLHRASCKNCNVHSSAKLAGISKRGMAQPRRHKG